MANQHDSWRARAFQITPLTRHSSHHVQLPSAAGIRPAQSDCDKSTLYRLCNKRCTESVKAISHALLMRFGEETIVVVSRSLGRTNNRFGKGSRWLVVVNDPIYVYFQPCGFNLFNWGVEAVSIDNLPVTGAVAKPMGVAKHCNTVWSAGKRREVRCLAG